MEFVWRQVSEAIWHLIIAYSMEPRRRIPWAFSWTLSKTPICLPTGCSLDSPQAKGPLDQPGSRMVYAMLEAMSVPPKSMVPSPRMVPL